MLGLIKDYFNNNLLLASSGVSTLRSEEASEHATRLALAALLVEVAESDYKNAPEEQAVLLKIVKETFKLSPSEAEEIIALAKEEHKNATDYFQFTRLINEHYSAEKKIQLIENLWQVAFSDHQLDKYEEHVIRRIADLIYVSHSDFMATKLKIQSKICD